MGSYMKANKKGTLCAFGTSAIEGSNDGTGEGIAVGPYFKFDRNHPENDAGCFSVCNVEYDGQLDCNKVIIIAKNCQKYNVPVFIGQSRGGKANKMWIEKPVNLTGYIYILTEVVDRDISVSKFPTLKEAQEEMFHRYITVKGRVDFEKSAYADKHFPECLKEIEKNSHYYKDGEAVILKMSSYINDAVNHDNYDWIITRVEV